MACLTMASEVQGQIKFSKLCKFQTTSKPCMINFQKAFKKFNLLKARFKSSSPFISQSNCITKLRNVIKAKDIARISEWQKLFKERLTDKIIMNGSKLF